METIEVLLEPRTDAVNLVSGINAKTGQAYTLDQDSWYSVENVGNTRAELVAAAILPPAATRRGRRLLPRGVMAVREFKPSGNIPVWAWAAESSLTVLEIDLAQ